MSLEKAASVTLAPSRAALFLLPRVAERGRTDCVTLIGHW